MYSLFACGPADSGVSSLADLLTGTMPTETHKQGTQGTKGTRSALLAWDLVVKHTRGAALHPVLERGVHVPDAAPVDVVRLEPQVPRALGGDVAPLRGRQEPVQAGIGRACE